MVPDKYWELRVRLICDRYYSTNRKSRFFNEIIEDPILGNFGFYMSFSTNLIQWPRKSLAGVRAALTMRKMGLIKTLARRDHLGPDILSDLRRIGRGGHLRKSIKYGRKLGVRTCEVCIGRHVGGRYQLEEAQRRQKRCAVCPSRAQATGRRKATKLDETLDQLRGGLTYCTIWIGSPCHGHRVSVGWRNLGASQVTPEDLANVFL